MILRLLLALWVGIAASAAIAQEAIRMAVTTSFHNSGLAEVLLPEIKADLAIDVHLLVVGTGQALKLGRSGDVDAILVHSRAAEQAFVDEGFGTHRREIMYNDFVFVGPREDPAAVSEAATAAQSLQRIAAAEARFVSRGDDSGTHKKELALWADASEMPQLPWYTEVGAGMGAALNTAVGLNAYVLSDRASWLNFGNTADHAILFAGDPVLFNQYAFLPVSADLHPHVKASMVAQVEGWLTSDRARELIDAYKINDQRLFTFNAQPKGP